MSVTDSHILFQFSWLPTRLTHTHTHTFTYMCQFIRYLGDAMSWLLGARAHIILPVDGRRWLIGRALRQSKDTSMLEHLCSLFVACCPPVNSLHDATSRNVAGSRANQHSRLISNHVYSLPTATKFTF